MNSSIPTFQPHSSYIPSSIPRFPSGTEITFNCISNTIGEKTSWTIRCEDGSWLGQRSPSTCRVSAGHEAPDVGNTSCLWRKSEPHLVTFYDDREVEGEVEGEVVEFQPGAELVGWGGCWRGGAEGVEEEGE